MYKMSVKRLKRGTIVKLKVLYKGNPHTFQNAAVSVNNKAAISLHPDDGNPVTLEYSNMNVAGVVTIGDFKYYIK